MKEKTKEGFWTPCPRCKGTGIVNEEHGFFRPNPIEVVCKQCKGTKEIFYVLQCSRISLGFIDIEGGAVGGIKGFTLTGCIGAQCNLWDHQHGGGCLERKVLLGKLYGDEKR